MAGAFHAEALIGGACSQHSESGRHWFTFLDITLVKNLSTINR
jgi:hypothetical protein